MLYEVITIQSVDSLKLAQEINKQAEKNNLTMDILVEINIGNELSKSGIDKIQVEDFLYQISILNNIRIKGLMAIPPIDSAENIYDRMNMLFLDIKEKKIDNIEMSILSIGMTNDYDMAIKHGSNLIRIGTGIFGKRNYNGGI